MRVWYHFLDLGLGVRERVYVCFRTECDENVLEYQAFLRKYVLSKPKLHYFATNYQNSTIKGGGGQIVLKILAIFVVWIPRWPWQVICNLTS